MSEMSLAGAGTVVPSRKGCAVNGQRSNDQGKKKMISFPHHPHGRCCVSPPSRNLKVCRSLSPPQPPPPTLLSFFSLSLRVSRLFLSFWRKRHPSCYLRGNPYGRPTATLKVCPLKLGPTMVAVVPSTLMSPQERQPLRAVFVGTSWALCGGEPAAAGCQAWWIWCSR